MPDTVPLVKWIALLIEAANKTGRPLDQTPNFEKWMRDAGFVDIQKVVYKWPINPWPKNEKDKELGLWSQQNWLDGCQGFSLAYLTRVLGWKPEEVEVLLADIRKDLTNRKIHGYSEM